MKTSVLIVNKLDEEVANRPWPWHTAQYIQITPDDSVRRTETAGQNKPGEPEPAVLDALGRPVVVCSSPEEAEDVLKLALKLHEERFAADESLLPEWARGQAVA